MRSLLLELVLLLLVAELLRVLAREEHVVGQLLLQVQFPLKVILALDECLDIGNSRLVFVINDLLVGVEKEAVLLVLLDHVVEVLVRHVVLVLLGCVLVFVDLVLLIEVILQFDLKQLNRAEVLVINQLLLAQSLVKHLHLVLEVLIELIHSPIRLDTFHKGSPVLLELLLQRCEPDHLQDLPHILAELLLHDGHLFWIKQLAFIHMGYQDSACALRLLEDVIQTQILCNILRRLHRLLILLMLFDLTQIDIIDFLHDLH